MSETHLKALAVEARHWLLKDAAPLWAASIHKSSGLFAEGLTLKGAPVPSPLRTLVQARHIYSFCEIGRLGWEGNWQNIISATVECLLTKARRKDGFFVHSLTLDGHVHDTSANLYDQAFILFCLAHAGNTLKRPDLHIEAARLTDVLLKNWQHPAGGFVEGDGMPLPRRQNPHMHLLEAFMALHIFTGEPRYKNLALMLAALGRDRFIDPATGAMREYFSDNLSPLDSVEGALVEPGHCLEWAWLYEELSAFEFEGSPLSSRLTKFARAHGIDADRGVAINEILTDGSVHDPVARLWPQTERLKAATARYRRLRSADELNEIADAYAGLKLYLEHPTSGLWHDKLQSDGNFVTEHAPGSSLYHITCAVSELVHTAAL